MGDSPRGAAGGDQGPSPTKRAWTVALFVVSLAAVGVMIGVLLPWPEADQEPTAAPLAASPTSGVASSPAPSSTATPKVVDEPFDPKAAIPGCDTVEQPDPSGFTAATSITSGKPKYDNPRFPWFNGPKATAMSNAVAELLPSGAEIDFASPEQSLIFGPITDYKESDPEPKGSTFASASVTDGDRRGNVYVTVQKVSAPIPPCVAGELDARRTLGDGTVVDVHDSWREVDGVRTNTRSASAYVADGSWIGANADDTVGRTRQEHSAGVPLTIDDLVRIVSDPRLRVSTPVPPGTPAPREECSGASPFDRTDGPPVTREQALRLDRVISSIDVNGRRLPPVQIGDFSNNTLCTSIPAVGADAGLDISITGGQSLPVEERPDPVTSAQKTFTKLQDGTVVQTLFANYRSMPMDGSGPSQAEASNTVTVTRPTGTQISVSSSSTTPNSALPLDRLESIALTPGLEL